MSERRTKGPGVPELLLDACTSGDTAAVRRLHQKNMYAFPANTEDGEGKTPLIRAVDGGHTETVGALLELGAKVDHQQRDGSTALHLACGSGQAEVVSLLVKAGANILLSDGDGDTALTRAERCADGTAVANVRQLLEEVAQKQGAEQEAKAKAAQDAREAAERVAAKQAAEQEEALAAKAARRQAREAEAKAAQEKQAPEAVDRVRVNEAAGGDAKARKKPAAKGPDVSHCAASGSLSSPCTWPCCLAALTRARAHSLLAAVMRGARSRVVHGRGHFGKGRVVGKGRPGERMRRLLASSRS